MDASVSMAKRASPFLIAILMITLILSLVSIYEGIDAYSKNDSVSGGLFLAMGVTTLVVTTYLWFQTRSRMLKLRMAIQPINTTLECQKCGFKNVREFQRGDYIFKHTEDQCPKCNEKTMSIGSIFREVKEKEKPEKQTTVSLR
jgi:Zn finger protein HypA/HybF involved in hydrogenase expression